VPLVPDWFRPVAEYMLREGLPETLRLAAIALVASTVVGLLLGTLMTVRFFPLRWLIRFYVEVWRGLPILVTVLFIYWLPAFDIGTFHVQLNAYQSAALALSLWGSAQVAEATRGAIESIPKEQHEAAAALGFGWIGRHRFVILPQATRRLLPPMVGLLVNIIQNTTIAGLIGVGDALETGTRSTERLLFSTGDAHYLQIYLAVFVFFFALSYPLTRLAALVEKRLAS
jgi:polar amino acid transport system permease protein